MAVGVERASAAPLEVSWLARLSWALFKWANQPVFTVITTFIFAPYFTSAVVGNPIRGQALWADAQSVAGICIALASPFLGSIADAAGPRKFWTLAFQIPTILGCAALWWVKPGTGPEAWFWGLAAVVVITIGAEISIVFNNAMLPTLVRHERIGRLSGFAWGLGYVGGIVSLLLVLLGFSLPEHPWLGLDKAMHENDRIVGPLVALWIGVFVLPLFFFTPDQSRSRLGRLEAAREGVRRLAITLRKLKHYRNIALFLLARMIAYDGLNAVFAFGGIYAAGMFGWETTSLGIFGIVILVFGAIGCWIGGWLDDRIGSKPTMQGAVIGVLLATFGILSMTRQSVLFGLAVDGPAAGAHGALFASTAERIFMVFGIMIGIFGGPMQAAARSMMARLAPKPLLGQFFGLYALTGEATAFFVPFLVSAMTKSFDSQRAGLIPIVVVLAVGFALMIGVRELRAELAE